MRGRALRFIKRLYYRFIDDEVLALGSQMAYNLLISFFPFIIFLISLIGYTSVSNRQALEWLLGILPEEAYNLVRETVVEVVEASTGGLVSISGITAVWFSSNGIGSIIRGLNKAYDEPEKRPFWKVKLISIIFTLIFTLGILFSFVLLVFGGVIKRQFIGGSSLPIGYQGIWDAGRFIFMISIILFIFIVVYRCLPSRRMGWLEVFPGAIFSASGWLATSMGFSFYVDNFGNYSRFYGSIGGLIILLIWLYLSAVVILIGGEINATLVYGKVSKIKKAKKQKN